MNAGCEHQRKLKWGDKKLTIYHYSLNEKTSLRQDAIKTMVEDQLRVSGKAEMTPDQQKIFNLSYSIKYNENLPKNLREYYEVMRTEEKSSGWVEEKEHPEGVLSKPCPKCGYKYGTSWKYKAISKEDLREIIKILEIPGQFYSSILKAGV